MIDIRRAKDAKEGLYDLGEYLNERGIQDTMVEIGTFAGTSTTIFLDYFRNIYCIDPWNPELDKDGLEEKFGMESAEQQFDEVVFRGNEDRIKKLKMTSEEAVKSFDDNTLDFVYIDGDHSYEGVKKDIELWYPKVKEGGYIGGHDYNNPPHIGVKRAVDEAFVIDKKFRDTSWTIKKE